MLKKINLNLLLILVFFLFSPLYFFNLGGYSLVDFDEAWWAEVARQILERHNPFLLYFNGEPMFFHPPFGYILIALSQAVFGISDFAARLPSALLGFGSVILTYLVGRNLFNKYVGFYASLVLTSSVWFVLRARSGNLDTILLFLALLTFHLFTLSGKKKIYLYLSAVSFSCLMMTKTLIGAHILPALAIYYLLHKKDMKIKINDALIAILSGVAVAMPYLALNYLSYDTTFIDKLYQNGVKPGYQQIPNFLDILNTKSFQFIHYGIREWFYPFLIALTGSVFFLKKEKNILVLFFWILPLLFAFLFSQLTEIWHLIPLYAPIGIIIGIFAYKAMQLVVSIVSTKIKFKTKNLINNLSITILSLSFIFLNIKQIYEFQNEINLFSSGQSGLAVVSAAAKARSEPMLYLDDENFLPSPVYYSHKKVVSIRSLPAPLNTLSGFIKEGPPKSLLITEKWRMEADNIESERYQVIKEHNGSLLIYTNF